MKMGMSMSMHTETKTALTTGMILKQKLLLIQAMRLVKYEPIGICPECGRVLTPAEIISGFNRDPQDYTTACTACDERFNPRLIINDGAETYSFLCEVQAIGQARELLDTAPEQLDPTALQVYHPAIFHSLMVHRGSIQVAYIKAGGELAKIAKRTEVEPIPDAWRKKIIPFLGQLPDTQIAACLDGISVGQVRRLRRKENIKPCCSKS